MSLRVLVDNKEVALNDDVEIVVKVQNHFYGERKEDSTYPFKLNLKSNRHVFNFLERINGNMKSEFPVKVYYGPYQILTGRSLITDVDETSVEFFITTYNQSFWGRTKEMYLDQMELGVEHFGSVDLMLEAFTRSLTEEYDYVACPLHDPFLPNIGVSLQYPIYNFIEPGAGKKFTRQYKEQNNIFCPFVRLNGLIRRMIESMGYRLVYNVLDTFAGFKDIMVVSRRGAGSVNAIGSTFFYHKHVPGIPVSDFINEIENKFGVMFSVNEGNKTISIDNNTGSNTLEVEVLDGINKHWIDADDKLRGFVFSDKDSDDVFVDAHEKANELKYIHGIEKDAKTVECISNMVGIKKITFTDSVFDTYVYCGAVQAVYADKAAYDDRINKEFRLSIYRGYARRSSADGKYPLADSTPPPDKLNEWANKDSLLWTGETGLFNTYQKNQISMKMNLQQEHEFVLTRNISRLKDLQQIFRCELVIRNRKYRCFEQEITFSKNNVVSHVIRCYPV